MQWIGAIFHPDNNEVPITMEYKKELISQAVKDMDCFQIKNITEPEDAHIELGEDGYYVEPEIPGNCMVFERVLAKVEQAVSEGASSVQLTDEDYVSAKYTTESDEIVGAMERINGFENAVITYKVMGKEEVLDKEQIRDFVTVDGFDVSLKEDKITDYVQMIASKYNTYADVRKFHTSSGDTVDIGGGDYGWIVDKPGEAEQLIADLEAGKAVEREPVYSQRAFVDGEDDIGDTYVEIDYTKQHLWYYEDGQLVVESDLVSGNINRDNGSPDGAVSPMGR